MTIGSPTHRLAEALTTFSFDELPDDAKQKAAQCLLDTIGVTAYGGRRLVSSEPFFDGVARLAGGVGASGTTVVARREVLPHQYAALVNGAAAHSMDFDDTHLDSRVHPGSCVIPAAMAAAERDAVDGKTLLESIVAGYEAMCRLGGALGPSTYDRGFHVTAVTGVFGAAAAIARVRGFESTALANLWGIVLSQAAGSQQYLMNGSWTKRLHPGLAAHNAFIGEALADAGVLGASEAFEGRYGFLNAFSDDADETRLTDDLGQHWVMASTALKPFPSCRFAHGAIDAVQAILGSPAAPRRDDIVMAEEIVVTVSPRARILIGEGQPQHLRPHNIVDAQFSLHFQVAAALVNSVFTWGIYDHLADPDTLALASRVRVRTDSEMAAAGAEVTVRLPGATLTQRCDVPRGEPGSELADEEVERKFLSNAGPVLGDLAATNLARLVWRLHDETDLTAWFEAMRLVDLEVRA